MDPGWPRNPDNLLICVLCKAAVPFINDDSDQFSRHLMMDHSAYFNLNFLIELSRRQPGGMEDNGVNNNVGEEIVSSSVQDLALKALNEITPPGTPEDVADAVHVKKEKRLSAEADSTSQLQTNYESGENGLEEKITADKEKTENNIHKLQPLPLGPSFPHQVNNTQVDQDFDLGFFINQISHEPSQSNATSVLKQEAFNYYIPNPSGGETFIPFDSKPMPFIFGNQTGYQQVHQEDDFSFLDPISFVAPDPNPSLNINRHLVPEDLQAIIIGSNPNRGIKFTYSQRLNTQMVVDDFVLKKKKGPYMTKGGRVVNWKCANDRCQYTAVTWEGRINDSKRHHNHNPQPELYAKKQARFQIRENMVDNLDKPASNLVDDVVGQANPETRQMMGSVDALKQAARRYTRKLRGIPSRPRGRGRKNMSLTYFPMIPGLNPETKEFEIVNYDNINSYEFVQSEIRLLETNPLENFEFTLEEETNIEDIAKIEMRDIQSTGNVILETECPDVRLENPEDIAGKMLLEEKSVALVSVEQQVSSLPERVFSSINVGINDEIEVDVGINDKVGVDLGINDEIEEEVDLGINDKIWEEVDVGINDNLEEYVDLGIIYKMVEKKDVGTNDKVEEDVESPMKLLQVKDEVCEEQEG